MSLRQAAWFLAGPFLLTQAAPGFTTASRSCRDFANIVLSCPACSKEGLGIAGSI